MSVEDIFLVRFDFIEHSRVDELEDILNDFVNTDIDISESLSRLDHGSAEVCQWKKTEQLNKEPYDSLEFHIYNHHGYLIIQTRFGLSKHTIQHWLPTSDRAKPQKQLSANSLEYPEIVSELNQICSKYPSLVNQILGDDSPTVLHCAVNNPPELDSISHWIEEHISSLRELGFTQTSGLQTVVDGTYLISLESFPNHCSGIIAVNIYTSTQNKSILSSDADKFLKTVSHYHLAHYALANYEHIIKSNSGLKYNVNEILKEEQLDKLIEIESTLISELGLYNDIQSDLQPQSPLFSPDSSIEEQAICRKESGELAETTYFEYYQTELNRYYQDLVSTIDNVHSQNERLLSLVRDRVSAIGTQTNVQLQTAIYYLTIVTAIAAVISLVIAFADVAQINIERWFSRFMSVYDGI